MVAFTEVLTLPMEDLLWLLQVAICKGGHRLWLLALLLSSACFLYCGGSPGQLVQVAMACFALMLLNMLSYYWADFARNLEKTENLLRTISAAHTENVAIQSDLMDIRQFVNSNDR